MMRSTVLLTLFFFLSCAAPHDLALEQMAKVDPGLRVLLERDNVADTQFDVRVRPDGSREYGVIVYGSDPDSLRSLGIRIQTVLGEMMTARVTVPELRILAAQSSVRSILKSEKASPDRF